jgi:hypothetical protein
MILARANLSYFRTVNEIILFRPKMETSRPID